MSDGPDPVNDGVAERAGGLHELERPADASTDDWAPVHGYANNFADSGAHTNGCFAIADCGAFAYSSSGGGGV
ncbi:MAG TPA: hypothetical protein VGQ62_16240 [Chloroflexota bacterium]|jgi:hypothetical protein|nr:hypothetical protein [Chloroflexota bacterium]